MQAVKTASERRTVLAFVALVWLSSPVLADPGAEATIVETIEARRPAAIELLTTLVNLNSGTLNLGGVRRVGEVLDRELEALGFETEWIEGAAVGRAGHLVARRPGRGPKVLLIGHLDTVFEPESPLQRLEPVDDRWVRGPGITDMKGGLVVMLEALHGLAAVSRLDDLQLVVVLTGDEERSGKPLAVSRAELVEAGRWADVALGFEDGDGNPETAVIARRGSTTWRLTVTGTPAHSSQVFTPQAGDGAIYEAARILEGFRTRLAPEVDLTYNPGLILGGTELSLDDAQARGSAYGKNNVVAGHALVTGDLRAVSPQQLEHATTLMHEVVAAGLDGTTAQLEISEGYPPMGPTEGNRRLLALYDRVSRDLGFGPVAAVNPRDAGAADISFVAAEVEMALDGLGLMGRGGHTVDETADMETLTRQSQRAAVLLSRLATRAD